MQARYRPGLPLVLKGLSFTIPSGATCGVVGRTGSGKSSLLLTLFDLIDIVGGRVLLDGVDVSRVSLSDLRSQMAIIPQDPLLFSGVML
jgi:ABC-type multidrug transport system fused ATPase/permease subunit